MKFEISLLVDKAKLEASEQEFDRVWTGIFLTVDAANATVAREAARVWAEEYGVAGSDIGISELSVRAKDNV